jgi:hypothetical protein
MKRQNAFVTNDGKVHWRREDAEKHLEEKWGAELRALTEPLTDKLGHKGSITVMLWLDEIAKSGRLHEALTILADKRLRDDDEDEGDEL